jgi:hypothetical protein
MTALEIHSNGKKMCTIGPEGIQILHVSAFWHESSDAWEFRIRGITNERGYEEHLNWMDEKLDIGDTITLKVVETEKTDEPKRRYRVP